MNKRRAFLTGAVAVGVGSVVGASLVGEASKTPSTSGAAKFPDRKAKAGSARNAIPNVEVVSHDGRKFRFYDDLIKDKVVMINFFYAECGETCPLVNDTLRKGQEMFGERFGREIFLYSITLRPGREGPDLLKQYAEVHGTGPGWLFLTGAPDDIELLRKRLGFTDPDPAVDALEDSHTNLIRYGNDTLKRWAGGPALGRPEGIVYALVNSVMDAGIDQPAVTIAPDVWIPPAPHDHHHHHDHSISQRKA